MRISRMDADRAIAMCEQAAADCPAIFPTRVVDGPPDGSLKTGFTATAYPDGSLVLSACPLVVIRPAGTDGADDPGDFRWGPSETLSTQTFLDSVAG